MSQYKITKKRLAQIIKEEYDAAMLRTDEGHGAFGIANRDEDTPKSNKKKKKADADLDEAHCGSANRDEKKKKPDEDGDGVPDWADKKPGEDDHADKKKMKKESLDSIRTLIQQELKNL